MTIITNTLAFSPERNGTAHFFVFSLIIEGTTEKVLQVIMPLKSIYNEKTWFDRTKNAQLNALERFEQ
jgi:hypothetical protein